MLGLDLRRSGGLVVACVLFIAAGGCDDSVSHPTNGAGLAGADAGAGATGTSGGGKGGSSEAGRGPQVAAGTAGIGGTAAAAGTTSTRETAGMAGVTNPEGTAGEGGDSSRAGSDNAAAGKAGGSSGGPSSSPVTSAVVTPAEGGILASADGRVRLEVPPGAVAADLAITIQATEADGAQLVPGSVYELGPSGTKFAAPVMLSIGYRVGDVPSGVTESQLRVQKAVNGGWTVVEGSTVDAINHVAHAPLHGFSMYGVRSASAPLNEAALGQVVVPLTGTALVAHVRYFDSYVYWSRGGTIERAPADGGSSTTLVSNFSPTLVDADPAGAHALVKVGSTLFFSGGLGIIYSVPAAGGAQAVHAGVNFAFDGTGLVTDGTDLYWTGRDNGASVAIRRASASASSCHVENLQTNNCFGACSSGQAVTCDAAETTAVAACCTVPPTFAEMALFSSAAQRLVLADGFAYWTEVSSGPSELVAAWVRRRSLAGGAIETLAEESRPRKSTLGNELVYRDIAVGGGRVYWARFDYDATPVDNIKPVQIRAVPLSGGAYQIVSSVAGLPALAADASHLYYAVAGSSPNLRGAGIFRVSHAGGEAFKLAYSLEPGDLSLSPTHVYYSDRVNSAPAIRRVEN